MANPSTALDQAIDWHVRLPALSDAERPDFILWLEASAEHRAAYDLVTEAEAIAVPVLVEAAPLAAADANGPSERRRFGSGWAFGAAAAACLALVTGWSLWPSAANLQIERTAPGTTKELAFEDGSRIDLNGATVLAFDAANTRKVRLDSGEARFSVQHGGKPFSVAAGGFELRDMGTVFNVRLTDRTLHVDVSEGRVVFDPAGVALSVEPGQQINVDRARNVVVKQDADASADWRRGEFVFSNATLADLAEALHDRYGLELRMDSGLSERPFNGNVRFTGNAAEDVAHLAGLIGAQYRREGDVWVIVERAGSR